MNNRIKTILMAAVVSSVVLTQGVCVSAAQFDDGASAFSDGTGSVSALASTLAKQTEEQTQEFVAKEEEAAQIREERRVEKAQKASEKAEQEKEEALQFIQQTIEDAKKKAEEDARKKAEEEAKKAEASAKALFGGAGDSEHMPSTELAEDELASGVIDLMTLLVKTGLCTTKSDARRNIQQGGVTVDDEKVTDTGKTYTADELKAGLILRRGKKNFHKVILK